MTIDSSHIWVFHFANLHMHPSVLFQNLLSLLFSLSSFLMGDTVLSQIQVLCAVRVPVVPILTTAALRGTTVSSSLGTAWLPQWSQTQVYTSNVYSNLSQAKQLSTDAGCRGRSFL